MKAIRSIELVNKIKSSPNLLNLVKKLQLIRQDKNIDINNEIYKLNLPIGTHLFITGNFSDLMDIKWEN